MASANTLSSLSTFPVSSLLCLFLDLILTYVLPSFLFPSLFHIFHHRTIGIQQPITSLSIVHTDIHVDIIGQLISLLSNIFALILYEAIIMFSRLRSEQTFTPLKSDPPRRLGTLKRRLQINEDEDEDELCLVSPKKKKQAYYSAAPLFNKFKRFKTDEVDRHIPRTYNRRKRMSPSPDPEPAVITELQGRWSNTHLLPSHTWRCEYCVTLIIYTYGCAELCMQTN